jgi:hypothetical protein
MGPDRMRLRYAYHKPFTIKFPDKCEWQNGFNPEGDGGGGGGGSLSKTNKGTGAWVYRWGLRRGTAAVLGSTPQYSRLDYTPLNLV